MSEKQVDEQVEDKFGTDADLIEGQDAASSDLAEETLADTEESSEVPEEKPEDRPSVADHAKLREQRREARDEATAAKIEAAELRGQVKGMQERQVTEAEVSPIQTAMKKQGVDSEAELDLTTGETMMLMRQEQKWDSARTAKATAADAETVQQAKFQTQFKAEVAIDRGEGLDYKTVTELGQDLLTKGELVDVADSPNPYELGYKLCIRAIQERGDESTKSILQERLTRKTKKSAEGNPPEKPVTPSEDEKDGEEVDDNHIANPRLRALRDEAFAGGSGE